MIFISLVCWEPFEDFEDFEDFDNQDLNLTGVLGAFLRFCQSRSQSHWFARSYLKILSNYFYG